MNKLLTGLALAAILCACQMTPQKAAVTTLSDIGLSGNTLYEGYLQAVLTGLARTNEVPQVTAYYRNFQSSFAVAVSAAHFSTNATPANPELLALFTKLSTAITTAKNGGK